MRKIDMKCARCQQNFEYKIDYIEHEPACIRKHRIKLAAEKAMKQYDKALWRLVD